MGLILGIPAMTKNVSQTDKSIYVLEWHTRKPKNIYHDQQMIGKTKVWIFVENPKEANSDMQLVLNHPETSTKIMY